MCSINWTIVFAVVLVCALIAFGPIITIHCLNTLFGLSIPVSLKTWFATLWLGSFFVTWKNNG